MQNLTIQLDSLIKDIERLITLTYDDITHIKNAQHDRVSENHQEKHILIIRFERNKTILNETLMRITQEHPDRTLSELLPQSEQEKLDIFKKRLHELHEANKIYGKFVASLHEFFNSLVSAILPMKEEGYARTQPKPAAFLQVSA